MAIESHDYSILAVVIIVATNGQVKLKKTKFKTLYQVALKRQQAAEDKIALHLASVESGTALETLPPGRIYGMRVTGPCPSPGPEPDSAHEDQTVSKTSSRISSSFDK